MFKYFAMDLTCISIAVLRRSSGSCSPLVDGLQVQGKISLRKTPRGAKLLPRLNITYASGTLLHVFSMRASLHPSNCRAVNPSNDGNALLDVPLDGTNRRSILVPLNGRARSAVIRDASGQALVCCRLNKKQQIRVNAIPQDRRNAIALNARLGAELRKLQRGASTFARVLSVHRQLSSALSPRPRQGPSRTGRQTLLNRIRNPLVTDEAIRLAQLNHV